MDRKLRSLYSMESIFNCTAGTFSARRNNCIPLFEVDVMIYPCPNPAACLDNLFCKGVLSAILFLMIHDFGYRKWENVIRYWS